ncbi:AI-2E family transporter [Nodosilinea sp. PGN35]|uniref:AI-2E family transporter n=1 Tax=Nodosilinea sp. PGN35 TaxID=3020489 RepID=UPI0023B35722|nr:AI-2E family transporter [Nodosilinea sp. TSF1-S3]MDF0369469.1 AI-2E family transporter [Nodosilinea sp. TSF1-S3]
MQALDRLPRWLVWEIALPLTILNLWLLYKVFQTFQTPITMLIAATLLSFLLNYPIEQLEKRGIKPGISIALILLVTGGLVAVLGFTLVPALLQQLGDLGNRLPGWLESGSQQFQVLDTWLVVKHIPLNVTALATQVAQMLPDEVAQLPDQLLEVLLGIADSLLEVLITAVLTLYLLLHGEEFWGGLLRWLPGNGGNQIRLAFQEKFKNYFVGQATIALLMATALSTVFFLLNIPYWLVFGIGIGLLALIPFGDIVGIFTAAIVVSFNSVLLGVELAVAALLIDQLIDSAVAPKILGDLIGLNPVWILVLLLVGSQLAGVLGLLLVVPLTGALKHIFEEVYQTAAGKALP